MSPESIICTCPKCGRNYRAPPELNGKRTACKSCKHQFVISESPNSKAPAPKAGAAAKQTAHPPAESEATSLKEAEVNASAPEDASTPEDAPIPFDDAPVPFDDPTPSEESNTETGESIVRVKIEQQKFEEQTTGRYMVIRILLAGKMIHSIIERSLNDQAESGWKLEHILSVDNQAYAIMSRDDDGENGNPPSQNNSSE